MTGARGQPGNTRLSPSVATNPVCLPRADRGPRGSASEYSVMCFAQSSERGAA